MGKMRILWNNLGDAAGTTLSVSSEETEWPKENVQNIWASWPHRTSSLGAPDYWAWDLGSALSISYVILWGHNFTSGATVKVQADVHDGHWADVDRALTYGVDWNDEFLIAYFSTPRTDCRYWRIIATDAANPDGYLQVSRAYIGSFFEPGFSFAKKDGQTIDPSKIFYSSGRQISASVKDPYDVFSYDFSAISPADILTFRSIFRTNGQHEPIFLIEDHKALLTSTKYAKMVRDFQYKALAGAFKAWSLEVEETL